MEEIKQYLNRLIEKSTPDKPVWNQEAILEGKPPQWSYIDGCMAIAILQMYEVTGEAHYAAFLETFIDYYVAEDGTILGYNKADYNADSINEGKVLFFLWEKTRKEKYRKAIEVLMAQVTEQPRIPAGNFWHKLIYPHQVWLDGLYMIQPFYAAYAVLNDREDLLQDSQRQFKTVKQLMTDEQTGLLYHGYDDAKEMFWADPKTGLSANFWTRSIGWYTMALVDVIEIIGEKHPEFRHELTVQLQAILDSLLAYQEPQTKLFYQVTTQGDKEGNYLETSGSCAIAYSLMKGARLNALAERYYDEGSAILQGVIAHKLVVEDGEFTLKDICLVAGLGGMAGKGAYKRRDGSFEYYVSEPKVDNDAKGIGPLVYAYSESLRHIKAAAVR